MKKCKECGAYFMPEQNYHYLCPSCYEKYRDQWNEEERMSAEFFGLDFLDFWGI